MLIERQTKEILLPHINKKSLNKELNILERELKNNYENLKYEKESIKESKYILNQMKNISHQTKFKQTIQNYLDGKEIEIIFINEKLYSKKMTVDQIFRKEWPIQIKYHETYLDYLHKNLEQLSKEREKLQLKIKIIKMYL